MTTIEFKSKKYTFKEEISIEDWLDFPEEDNPKKIQLHMIACMSIEPKLSYDELVKMPFMFMNEVLKIIKPSGE